MRKGREKFGFCREGGIRKSPSLKKMKRYQEEKGWRKSSMKIAVRVLHTLEEEGMTKRDMADQLGKSIQWVNEVCKGHRELSEVEMSIIGSFLGESTGAEYGKKYKISTKEFKIGTEIVDGGV